jgi:glycosyltransferase involved in cell wall biosynthesis
LKLDVCVCTHNPDLGVLRLVLAALAAQSLETNAFRVTVVDNASEPPIADWVIGPLVARGVNARIVREDNLGVAHARLRAARETDAAWVSFIDDDNVVAENYLEVGLRFAAANPHVGAFGGRLLLPPTLQASEEIKPFLPYLGIKDLGDVALSGPSMHWCEWEPPTAGSFVARAVLERFAREIERDDGILGLGRKGLDSPVSCEDSFIMRSAYALDLSLAYCPHLVLYHHLRPHRLTRKYLFRLLYGYGTSHVLLERCLNPGLETPAHYKDESTLRSTLWHSFWRESKKSLSFSIALLGYHVAAYRAYRTEL